LGGERPNQIFFPSDKGEQVGAEVRGKMIVKQLAVGGLDHNFSYLVFDEETGEAALIDPTGNVGAIRDSLKECQKIHPRYVLLTHGHHDHYSGIGEAKTFFDAPIAAHPGCSLKPDIELKNGQRLPLGKGYIECIYSPGHSGDSVIYRLSDDSAIFTGDTLFVDWCGYCDPETMFHTMREVVYPLADSNEVYPGHDYGRLPHAPLGEEKKKNPYLYTTDYNRFCEELKKL
jgi:hydroxyacylglutathione hydrolase